MKKINLHTKNNTKKPTKEQRLANQLRQNLLKRKAQAKNRQSANSLQNKD